jgi:DNA polymerase elongation subunit (family B)
VTGFSKDGRRHYLVWYGHEIYPSFGVPYEEFWRIKDDPRIKEYRRGPDSPFGEPVMEVVTHLPRDIGTGKDAMRKFVSHSYEGDIRFEKKAMKDKKIHDGYFKFMESKVEHDKLVYSHPAFDTHGYIDAKHVRPLDPGEERFFVEKEKLYWDTEWDMSMLKNRFGQFRGSRIENDKKDWEKVKLLTVVFYEFKRLKYVAFSWHPDLKKNVVKTEEYISRIHEKIREKINIPNDYIVDVRGFMNESDTYDAILEYLDTIAPDALLGYNSAGGIHGKGKDKYWINGFDMPYFYLRGKHLDKPMYRMSPMGVVYDRGKWKRYFVNIKMVTQVDLWHAAEFFDITWKDPHVKNKKLNTLMLNYLKTEKVPHQGYVWDEWMKDPVNERYYCTADVEGTWGIDVLFRMSEDGYNRAMFSGAKWEDYQFASKLHDQINLKLYKDLYYLDTKWQGERIFDTGEVIYEEYQKKYTNYETGEIYYKTKSRKRPWKRDWITDDIGIATERVGGYVPEPEPGFYEDVAVIDFNKFYPNSAIAANCGPETFINVKYMELDPFKELLHPGEGITIVEEVPYLKMEVSDWDAFYSWAEKEAGEGALPSDIQEVINGVLIGWEKRKHAWKDVNRTPAGFFRKDPVAKNVKAFNDLLGERKKLQRQMKSRLAEVKDKTDQMYKVLDLRQFSFKGLTNARFGVTGLPIDRTYMLPIFNTYTLVAQTLIRRCITHLIEVMGYHVIGGDTDSVFVKLKHNPEYKYRELPDGRKFWYCVEAQEMCEVLNKHVWEYAQKEFNFDNNTFNMDVEDISPYFYIATKKHYVKAVILKDGVLFDKPALFWKGLKRVSRSTSFVTDEVQDTIGAVIMSGGSYEDVEKICLEYHNLFEPDDGKEMVSPIRICKVMPLKKALTEYKKSSEQWKAFTLANDYFNAGYGLGSRAFVGKLKYCPKRINGRKVDPRLGGVVAFDEELLPKIREAGLEFDYDSLEDSSVAAAADELLYRFHTTYSEVISNARTFDPHDF